MTSPTQRTLKALRAQGLECAIVEKWNMHARRGDGKRGIRQDMFGIIDIVALDHERGVVGVQSTGTDFAGHMKKLKGERLRSCIEWLSTPGAHLELWGWRKVKVKRGGKAMKYEPRVHVFTLAELVYTSMHISNTR